MYKLRFNLGRGKNFMKWKVTYPNGEANYFDPDKVRILIKDGTLRNYRTVAERIHEGANKTVCAWVRAKHLEVFPLTDTMTPVHGECIRFNPRLAPYWTDSTDKNIDDQTFARMATDGRRLFVTNS